MSALQDNPFAGPIGAEYDVLRLLCPNAAMLARMVGERVAQWRPGAGPLEGFEIGCGTGISTLAALMARDDLRLAAVDSAGEMLAQARVNLADYVSAGRVAFIEADALAALRALPDASKDVVISNYAIHNFPDDYRKAAITEIFRALKPGGLFVNGDRYAMDDPAAHLSDTQALVRGWFKILADMKRLDLLEDWIVHLLSDESPRRIMYFEPALQQLRTAGFAPVTVEFRDGVDTLVTAVKPGV
ncbi:MAG: class I SAM-dependent methyltransferase [Alphaproteobacteria bacterium]|nr:class I SAM-dependent methyltransferase [Alphaproteobacteria bacterium]MBM3624615.1 class I SAM-dependent methyltransferase [Alphaproteobacteria bacterium]